LSTPVSSKVCSNGDRFIQQQIRANSRIRAREVRVILASNNEQLGIMKIQDALRKAQSLGLDLVEVAPNANPPVCKIVDFGKYRYDLSKQDKDRKSTSSKLKEIKFRVNIDPHDYMIKVRHAEQFLDKGNKIKMQLQFRGREMSHKELGDRLMRQLKEDLSTMGQVEMEPKLMGRSITMTLSPLPASKRKLRYTVENEELPPDQSDHDDHDDTEE
jgi:translation initiation factor IF-3